MRRVTIKMSGESLSDRNGTSIDKETISGICQVIKKCRESGFEISIVPGGGNFWRGRDSDNEITDRCCADSIGMLATVMNALALCNALNKGGVPAKMFGAMDILGICERFSREKAIECIHSNVIILGGGTGHPFVSSDSAAAMRALELNSNAILWCKSGIDGVYSADPKVDANAILLNETTYKHIITFGLGVFDITAAAMLDEKQVRSYVFNADNIENIYKVVNGEKIGTVING